MPTERAPGPADAATAPSGGAVAAHLARMHAQRVALFEALAGVPEGRSRIERPYPTDIDDVYQRPSMPSWAGFLWPPKRTPSRPAPLAELERVLADEHDAIARFYAGKPEPLLGHVAVWDPAIGRLNLVQVLRVGVHHDQHHFKAVRRLLGR